MSEQRGFLSRWALRKQQAQDGETQLEEQSSEAINAEELRQDDANPVAPTAETTTLAADEVSDSVEATTAVDSSATESAEEQLLSAEDLPDPEQIDVGGSFASFMGKNVDPSVRQAALRTLWKQPHYSEIDGMMEYALDYSNQEILTPEVSSELAKKVFRHLVQDDEPTAEPAGESLLAEQSELAGEEQAADADDGELTDAAASAQSTAAEQTTALAESSPLSDKLDGEIAPVSQNEPVVDEKNQGGVV